MKSVNWGCDVPLQLILILIIIFASFGILDMILIFQYRDWIRLLLGKEKNTSAAAIRKDWGLLADSKSQDIQTEIAYLRASQRAFELFQKKNSDYGLNNLAVGWVPGIAIRLGDKVSRLWTLLQLRGTIKRRVDDESVDDTLLDIVNYAIVGLLMMNEDISRQDIDSNIGMGAREQLIHLLASENLHDISD